MSMVKSPAASTAKPEVARPGSSRGVLAFALAGMTGGVLLFVALEGHRTAASAPAVSGAGSDTDVARANLPVLTIPRDGVQDGDAYYLEGPAAYAAVSSQSLPVTRTGGVIRVGASNYPSAQPNAWPPSPPPPMRPMMSMRESAELYGNVSTAGGMSGPKAPDAANLDLGAERTQAKYLANPSFTVPKGAIIQAVLESALDSTRPGLVRAIVSLDVRSFDGSRVLIPRGSRLVGTYKSELDVGQNRVVVQWQRLLRPDGAMIDLDSPATDPQGRAGVKGSVNSQFFGKLGDALLQSIFSIGSQVASREIAGNTGIYVMLPGMGGVGQGSYGAAQSSGGSLGGPTNGQGSTRSPILRVRQGTSTAVLVAKDLDFSGVGP